MLLAAMIPTPSESGFEWWGNTGQAAAQHEYLVALGLGDRDPMDPEVVFIHDFDADLKAESLHHVREQHAGTMAVPCPLIAWPDVPTRVISPAGASFLSAFMA